MLETIVAALVGFIGVLSALHALLYVRDPRSTLNWALVCILVPGFGALIYWVLGVNRIATRAQRWQAGGRFDVAVDPDYSVFAGELATQHPEQAETMSALLKISSRVTGRPLLLGNKVEPLFNGEAAYPAMLAAIAGARRSVHLCTYLFDTDRIGREFVDALGGAAARGVEVRVLLDAIGERYSRPRASKLLRRKQGVQVALFLPLALSLRGLRVNLRNHRKILVVDNLIGFTGGMNIGLRHMVTDGSNRRPTADIHFRVTGPAVQAMQEVFFEDWRFSTDKEPPWHEVAIEEPAGNALCRGISDGPNEDLEKLQWILVGALGSARKRVQIMTPYFIPSRELLGALNGAALRGVTVEIILPQKNNLPYVAWAAQEFLGEALNYGVRVFFQPPPFNHSKLFIVDEFYVNLGSSNLDPRSLRLNFEFNLEVFDFDLGRSLSRTFDRIRGNSRPLTLEELENRSFPVRLRDSICKVFAPYL